MPKMRPLNETDLAALTRRVRMQAKKTRAQAAREMGVSQTSIFRAEEEPEQSLVRLRINMIEAYSDFRVIGPVFILKRRR